VQVAGFRSPNWDINGRAWDALARAGYRYDASLMPTPFHTFIRLLLAVTARSLEPLTAMSPLPASGRRLPHRVRTQHGFLWELPVPVTPLLRLPLYHTVRHRLPDNVVDRAIRAAARRGEPFGYAFHAIDAVALSDSGIDTRLARHPGMHQDLESKLAGLKAALDLVGSEFQCITYRDLVDELEAADGER
jgi:hypothetical protein